MLPANRHAGRCIYCAFRDQQLALQARRLKSTSTRRAKAPIVSFYKFSRKGEEGGRLPHSRIRYLGAGDSKGRDVTQTLQRNFDQWGLDDQKDRSRTELGKDTYTEVLQKRLRELKEELKDAPLLGQLKKEKEDAGEKAESFLNVWKTFVHKLTGGKTDEGDVWFGLQSGGNDTQVQKDLRQAFTTRGQRGLDERIKYAFYAHITGERFTESEIKNQKTLADLRYPTEWYPATRAMHRKIHLHVGPTNSGKTYHALQRLEQAEKGVYAGPLRLLAHEVYTRMNAKGKACALVTGEERRLADKAEKTGDADMSSCTVEMMPLNKTLDVAVIDEIQMIGNADRGWAWTQALLGVKAKEVHLCGEERTVPLIQELCASVGEELLIHRYERLSPLKVADESLNGDLRRLRKGDCIVSFSVMGIHALRRQIERQTGRKVAIVYGSLPPETRAQQARLFNDPHNDYDFLVASDAVGMGLNLAIKRIIFESSSKFDGVQRRTLSVADTKQIGGRAGRYRTAAQAAEEPTEKQDLAAAKGDSPVEVVERTKNESVGLVTTLEKFDFPIVAAAMVAEPEPIRTAGLFPPASVLERFSSYFPPGTPFSYILTRLHELSQMHTRFHLCGLKEQIWVADIIEPVTGLTIADRNIICSAPASRTDDMWKTLMPAYARCIANQSGGNILDIEELPLEILEAEVSANRQYLRDLESLHKGIVTYLWLSYRFAGIFTTRALAFHIKEMVEEKIENVLSKFSFNDVDRQKAAAARQKQLLLDLAKAARSEEAEVEEARRQAAEGEETGTIKDESLVDESRATAQDLESQTSLSTGGDHFAGEADLALEESVEVEVEDNGEEHGQEFPAQVESPHDRRSSTHLEEDEIPAMSSHQSRASTVEDSSDERPPAQHLHVPVDITPAANAENSISTRP